MFVVQNKEHPSEIRNALSDLMRDGIVSARICSAYMSVAGSNILYEQICRSAPDNDPEHISKTIVASLDSGITDPDALSFWSEVPNCHVLVAGAHLLEQGNLRPAAAFHPKVYLFGRPDNAVGILVGSANLTNRGLTINSEVAQRSIANPPQTADANTMWDAVIAPAVPLTPEILDQYRAIRKKASTTPTLEELEPVPAPEIGGPANYPVLADLAVEPLDCRQMWIQARGMQGGAGTQLELPRGSHRFFGAEYADYEIAHVERIAEPVLVAGHKIWNDRPLTWHGDNAMERINLPSQAMGGYAYENSLILFRRVAPNTFELCVHPWDSDSARGLIEASRQANLIFRVGQNSNRIAGFLS